MLSLTSFINHPLHVTVLQADFNGQTHALEISCKFFREDLEEAIRNRFKDAPKVDLEADELHTAMDKLVAEYVKQHLGIQVNGKPIPVEYVGYEVESESLYAYIQVPKIPELKSVTFANTLLYDLFNDQINIMHVTRSGTRHSVRLNYPDKEISVKF